MPTALAAAYDQQDSFFSRAFDVLRAGIADRAFPGAAVALTHDGKLVALKGLGRFTYEPDSPEVRAETIFDLASVTKVVATTTMAAILHERGVLELNVPVAPWLPDMWVSPENHWERITPAMLLAHASGLPAYEKLYEDAEAHDIIPNAAGCLPEAEPGSRAEYSDIGFLILGKVLERVQGKVTTRNLWLMSSIDISPGPPVDEFCRREVFEPLKMARTMFNPPAEVRPLIPPTEDDRTFRKKIIQGEVHDENAWAMGGVAGHAGLFAPAEDLARFAHCMLQGGAPILRPETVELFTRRQTSPPGTSRALGWDTPSQPSQSGRYFSPRSFGHLGYTGTSLWIDPERRLSITLLTNRTWPDRSSQRIKEVRPAFHDAVVECLQLT